MKTFTQAAAAIALVLAAAPAIAGSAVQEPVAVAVADLDLGTAQGRQTLDLRLLRAARTACGTPSPADPRGADNLDVCVAEARASAAAQVATAVALARRAAPPVLAGR